MSELFKKAARSGLLGSRRKIVQQKEDQEQGQQEDTDHDTVADDSAEEHRKRLRKYREENP